MTLLIADSQSAKPAPGHWPDLSLAAIQQRASEDQADLQSLHAIARDRLSLDDRTAYDLLHWEIERRLTQFQLQMYFTPFWYDTRVLPSADILRAIEQVWSLPPVTSQAQVGQRLELLETFPAYVEQLIMLLRGGIQRGALPSQDLARPPLFLLSAQLRTQNGFNYFHQTAGETEAEKTILKLFGPLHTNNRDLARTAIREKVVPALRKYHDFLTVEYLPACPDSRTLIRWPQGHAIYSELARRYTTTDLTPEQLHELGLREVARIHQAMQLVIAKTGYAGSLDDFLQFARTDPRFYYKSQEELLAAYRAALARVELLVPKVIYAPPPPAISVEKGGGLVGASFLPGNGIVYVALGNPPLHPKFEVIPLMLHEGWPGHGLQYAFVQQSEASHPDPIRHFELRASWNTAFAEGWALYAEGLGEEMGLYTDPSDRFGELRMDLTRAVRMVVDTGMQVEEWSPAQAKQYFLQQTGKPEEEVDSEMARTLRPGVLLAYKAGQQQFESMRERAHARLGSRFDLGRFHSYFLRSGPLPLTVLQRKLDECLADRVCSSGLART